MTLHVKKGDTVLVIAGKDKGKSGKVLTAIPADNAVIVSDVNIVSKHKKPRSGYYFRFLSEFDKFVFVL